MARRYFNWKLAIVLVIGFVVLATTAFGLRQWRRSGRAGRGLEVGIKAYNERRWEDAAKNLGLYLAIERDDVPILLKYADAQLNIRPLKRGNIQQAIAAYRTILRVDKNNSEAATQLTEMYLGMGMPGEAELIAGRYLETNQDLKLRRMLAMALAAQRKFDEAVVELKSIIKEQPEQILAYELLGQLSEQRPENFPDPPDHWFNEAVKNNPSSALAYIVRAGFYLRSEGRPKALADLEQAEKLDLSDTVARLRLAAEFMNADVSDKAEQHLAAVQKAEPASQVLWQTWARFAMKSQSPEKMLRIAETGLKELSSQPWDFMLTAAELFIRSGQLDRATDCISKMRQKDIVPSLVTFLEGLVADQQGKSFEAVKCWYRAMQLGNKSPRIRLALASALSRAGDAQSALRQLRTLVSERPNSFNGRLALARMLAQTGNWAETAEQARMARQISPGSLDAALLYIQAQIQLLVAHSTSENAQMWQDIDKQLTSLKDADGGALEVGLLQLQCALLLRDFARAETLVTELKKSHPSQIRVALAEAELLAAQKREDEAVLALNKTIEKFPESVELVRYLAILLDRQENNEKCEAVIKDALARIEQSVAQRELGLLLAQIYTWRREEDNAYRLLNALAKKLPNDILIKRQFLRCKQVIEDLEKAQQLVGNIKSLEGENGWQWRYEQARVWFGAPDFKNRYPQIISLLKENLLANPDDQTSRMLLAHSYERAGESQLAISTYREALNRSPQDLRIIVPTVAALYKANEYGRADEILQRAAGEKLFHPELKRLEVQSYLRRGKLGSASDILENLLTDDPNNKAVCLSLALLKMRQDKFAEAGQLLGRLKIQEPNSLPVTVAQIELNVRRGKSAEALLLCDEIVNNLNNASAYILRAKTFVSLGEPNKAIEDFNYATTTEPNNVGAWVAKSDFYRSIGQPENAIADIQKALSMAPGNLQVLKRAISLFLASGNPDRVLQGRTILDKALMANPEDIELRLYKARSLLAEGTAPAIENAERILQKITEDQPKTSQAWVLLGERSLNQGQLAKAMDTALRGLVHKPNDRALLLLKARAEAERSPLLAIPTLKVLLELDPDDVDAAVLLAIAYIEIGEPGKAINLLTKQLSICDETSARRRYNVALAVALYKNDNKADAQKIFDSLYQSAPDDPGPLLAQARLLQEDKLWSRLSQMVSNWYQNHPRGTNVLVTIANDLVAVESSQAKKTAEDLLRSLLNREPNSVPAMGSLAMLLQVTDRSAESAPLYQRILTLQPDNVVAINNLAWIVCEEQGKPREALQLAQRGLKIAPNYVDLIDTNGMVYYRLGQYESAVRNFTRCIKLYPGSAPSIVTSYFHLGRALASLGRKGEAIDSLKKALELNTQIGGLPVADAVETERLINQLSRGG